MKRHRQKSSGRPRKEGLRYKSGGLMPAGPTPETLRHRQEKTGSKSAFQPEAEYVLGLLWLRKIITRRQHDAGIEFQCVHKRWCILNKFPRRFPVSLALLSDSGGSSFEGNEKILHTAQVRLIETLKTLKQCGTHVCTTTERVVIDDELPLPTQLKQLKTGLDALGNLFNLPMNSDAR